MTGRMIMNTNKETADNLKKNRKKYMTIAITIIVVTALGFIMLFMSAVRRIQYVYTDQTYQKTVLVRREALGSTVSNLVREIDKMRTLCLDEETAIVDAVKPAVTAIMKEKDPAGELKEYFASFGGKFDITCILYDKSGKAILDNMGLTGETGMYSEDLDDVFIISEKVSQGDYTALYGVTGSGFDSGLLEILSGNIAEISAKTGEKYWVDKMTVLDGGKVSVVRLIDSENPRRVGMSSGESADTDLEELRNKGKGEQVFAERDMEWLVEDDSRVTARSTTCSEYYEPYGWAVCGAFRMDAVGVDSVLVQTRSRNETIRIGIRMAIGFALVLGIAIILLLRNSATYFNKRHKKLKDQVEKDALTGANTRGYGQQILTNDFNRFTSKNDESPILMVMDVDKFKSINDTYGHDSGDVALKQVVKSALRVMRGKDCMIRWGGDEFIAVFYKLERTRGEDVANRLRKEIAQTEITHGSNTFGMTVSIGVTWFKFGDTSYDDALKRADAALYKSKGLGRNRVCVAEDGAANVQLDEELSNMGLSESEAAELASLRDVSKEKI